jgi:hypothetical protein
MSSGQQPDDPEPSKVAKMIPFQIIYRVKVCLRFLLTIRS